MRRLLYGLLGLLLGLVAACDSAAGPTTPTPIAVPPGLPTLAEATPTLAPSPLPTDVPPSPTLAVTATLALTLPTLTPQAVRPDLQAFQAGITVPVWSTTGYSTAACDAAWGEIAGLGANWVAIVPTGYQAGIRANQIGPDPTGRTASEASVRHAILAAHAAGLRVLLKPHVDSTDDAWRGTFRPTDPARWFASYRQFITGWARVAADTGVDLFSVGTELTTLSGPAHTADWLAVVAGVRAVYPGPLTYAANWGKRPADSEYQQIAWWDRLDYIGIDAYFPLSSVVAPTTADLQAGWLQYTDPWGDTYHWKDAITAVQARWERPVLFTEVGYTATPRGPAGWDAPTPRPGPTPTPQPDAVTQAAAYQALVAVWGEVPWFAGFYAWEWNPAPGSGGPTDATMLVNGKPAVLDALRLGLLSLHR